MKYIFIIVLFFCSPFALNAQFITIQKSDAIINQLIAKKILTLKSKNYIQSELDKIRRKKLHNLERGYRSPVGRIPNPDISTEDEKQLYITHNSTESLIYRLLSCFKDELNYRTNLKEQRNVVVNILFRDSNTHSYNQRTYKRFLVLHDSLKNELTEMMYQHSPFSLEQKVKSREKNSIDLEHLIIGRHITTRVETAEGGLISPKRSVIAKHRIKSWEDFHKTGLISDKTYQIGMDKINSKTKYFDIYQLLNLAAEESFKQESTLLNNYKALKYLKKWVKNDILSEDEYTDIYDGFVDKAIRDGRFSYFNYMSNAKTYPSNVFKDKSSSFIFKEVCQDINELMPFLNIEFTEINGENASEINAVINIQGNSVKYPITHPQNEKIDSSKHYLCLVLRSINSYLKSTNSEYLLYFSKKRSYAFLPLTEVQKETVLYYDGDNFISLP